MPKVSAPRLISDSKAAAQQTAPALDAAVKTAGGSTTAPAAPRRTRRKPSAQNAPSSTDTSAATSTKGRTRSRAQKAAEPAEEPPQAAEVTEATQTADTSRERRKPEFPDEPDGIPGAKRITLPLWYDLWKKLRRRSVEDEIDTTIVIRSAIELYFHDERFQAKVDKLAKLRASSIHRGRPRKDSSR